MQFALLISSLINIISLDVTSFNSAVTLKLKCGSIVCVEFFIFGGSLLGRIQGDREPVSLKESDSIATFKSKLKTFMFIRAFDLSDRSGNEGYRL